MLLARIEEVYATVAGVLSGWRRVDEEGGVCRRLVRDCCKRD